MRAVVDDAQAAAPVHLADGHGAGRPVDRLDDGDVAVQGVRVGHAGRVADDAAGHGIGAGGLPSGGGGAGGPVAAVAPVGAHVQSVFMASHARPPCALPVRIGLAHVVGPVGSVEPRLGLRDGHAVTHLAGRDASRDASRRSVGAAVLAAAEDREHGQRRASAEQGQQARREHGREDPMAAGPAHCVFLSDQKGFCPPTTTSTVRQGCWTVPYPVAEITVYASSPAFT